MFDTRIFFIMLARWARRTSQRCVGHGLNYESLHCAFARPYLFTESIVLGLALSSTQPR